jgi:hypothetical protein
VHLRQNPDSKRRVSLARFPDERIVALLVTLVMWVTPVAIEAHAQTDLEVLVAASISSLNGHDSAAALSRFTVLL